MSLLQMDEAGGLYVRPRRAPTSSCKVWMYSGEASPCFGDAPVGPVMIVAVAVEHGAHEIVTCDPDDIAALSGTDLSIIAI